jgi:molecular chaperone GrpE (heat shock protein)
MGLLNKRRESDEEIEDGSQEDAARTAPGGVFEEVGEPVDYVPPAASEDEWTDPLADDVAALRAEVAGLTAMLREAKASADASAKKLDAAVTSKEAMKTFMAAVEKRDAEMASKKLMTMLDGLAHMREDFFKLSKGMKAKIDTMDANTVLSSFDAYNVDMENILLDCGVEIGPFPYDKLNTIHQRIVDVVPTDDPEKDGKIAERVSDGYRYDGRVLYKERVNVYKFTEKKKKSGKEDQE